MAINTSTIDGQDHIVGEGAFTRCGLRLPFGTPYEVDVEPENPCPVCFPDAKPKKAAKAESASKTEAKATESTKADAKPANSTKKSVGDKA